MSLSPRISSIANASAPDGIGMAFAVGFYFSFRAVIVLFCVRVLGIEARTAGELGLAWNLFFLVLVCFHSLGAARYAVGSMLRLPSIRWVLGFLVFSFCSLAWSSTESLPSAIAYWCALAADIFMVVLLLRAAPLIEVASSLMKGFVWSSCALALFAWILPAQADLRLGDVDFFNANQVGFLCAFAFFLAQYLVRTGQGKWGFAAFLLAITMLRSLSKTTIVAFLASQTLLLIQDKSLTRRTKLLLTAAAILVVFLFWGLIEAYYDVYINAGNQSETLTGRIGIWAYILDAALEQPWLGHGFNSVWKVVPAFGEYDVRHAENELLQQFYAYGLAGICLLAALYGSLYRQFRKLTRGPLKIFFLSLMLFIIVRGLAEAEPFDLLLPLWSIILISLLADHALQLEQTVPTKPAQQSSSVARQDSVPLPGAWGILP